MTDISKTATYPPGLVATFWLSVLVFVIGGILYFWFPLIGSLILLIGSLGAVLTLLRGEEINDAQS